MDDALKQRLAELPQSPGCYLMRDHAGVVIYVGKAINLRARVRSYFNHSDPRAFVQRLDEILADVEVLLTRTEKEALLLENELIKQHKPRFNVMLRDDKNFISLRLDVRQPYPRLEVVRRTKKDGARYFGPYASASAIRETLRVVNRHFQLRTCSDTVMRNRQRPCLQYQIHRCPGPCVLEVPREDYARSVSDVGMFLSGRADELTVALRDRMKTAARELRFEHAAVLRDQLQAMERSLEKQRAVSTDGLDQDAVALHREGPLLVVQLFFVRNGRLSGGRHFPFKGQEFPDDELLGQFLAQYYGSGAFIPREVLLPLELDDAAAHAEWLTELKGEKVAVLAPQRGDRVRLVEMARENAAHNFREWRRGEASTDETLARLMGKLRLRRMPRRIECYDNSHLQGTLAVGSCVAFTDGEPDKGRYRHFKVRSAAGDDDFRMMQEVLTRRLTRGATEDDLPDLIVVDGGKGQLGVAQAVLKDLGLTERVELCSLAKARVVDDERLFAARQGFEVEQFKVESSGAANEDELLQAADTAEPSTEEVSVPREGRSRNPGRWKKDRVEQSPERVFLPGQKNPIVLRANSAELFLLQRLRDEAHRFAIGFQRRLRRSTHLRSLLREAPGVGEGRQKQLLRHFGSLRRVREASVEELAAVDGMPRRVAEELWAFLHPEGLTARAPDAVDVEELALADAGLGSGAAEDEAEEADEDPLLEELAGELLREVPTADGGR